MSTVRVAVADRSITVTVDDTDHVLPVGPHHLRDAELHSDPPRPEQLTNAIGSVVDHLDDLLRDVPMVATSQHVVVSGSEILAIASVELGETISSPFTLTREAAEDVFRTLATERSADRVRNPGLPAHLVDSVVAGCCVLVALMRHLHLDQVEVQA